MEAIDADGYAMDAVGAADRGVQAQGQDPTSGSASHDLGHPLAASERSQVAAVPEELGPWWRAAQIFIRRARAGVSERFLNPVQECGIKLGMVLLDGTSVRAHQKAAGVR